MNEVRKSHLHKVKLTLLEHPCGRNVLMFLPLQQVNCGDIIHKRRIENIVQISMTCNKYDMKPQNMIRLDVYKNQEMEDF
jgi:hypothetical protein